jgi:IS5 family transposase
MSRQCTRGQFVLNAKALPGNPNDGHSLKHATADTERLTGCSIERAFVEGYRGHDSLIPHRVFISGQKRGGFGITKCELRRRSAIEAVIGHLKAHGTSADAISRAVSAMPPTPFSARSATTSAA